MGIFLFTTASKPALGPTQPPIQWVPGVLFIGTKRPGREADHSPPSNADVKNAWSYTSTPPIHFHGVLLKAQGNCTLVLERQRERMVTKRPMQRSPSEADSHSASQQISHLLWNPKVYYRVHKGLILSEINPLHIFAPYFSSILIIASRLHLGHPSDLFPPCFLNRIL
jgi:hypothetical protein